MNYLIVGFGNIGHKRFDVLGKKCIATVDPDKKQKADYKYSSEVSDDILKKIDNVVVAVPRQPKLKIIEYWLKKGKNVLVEKPLILDQKTANKFSKIAKEKNVIWYTSYNHRFESNIVHIKKFLDKNTIGNLYHAKMVYGFGNVQQTNRTWRESGFGTLDETGCHIIDFANYFFGYSANSFENVVLLNQESKTLDHCVFRTKDGKLLMEVSWTTWKNVFSIDIYGNKGSIHMHGLNKWGGSELILRKRIFPAGIPKEKKYITSAPDITWAKDVKYFESMVKKNITSYKSDLFNTDALVYIVGGNKNVYKKLQGLDVNIYDKRAI